MTRGAGNTAAEEDEKLAKELVEAALRDGIDPAIAKLILKPALLTEEELAFAKQLAEKWAREKGLLP